MSATGSQSQVLRTNLGMVNRKSQTAGTVGQIQDYKFETIVGEKTAGCPALLASHYQHFLPITGIQVTISRKNHLYQGQLKEFWATTRYCDRKKQSNRRISVAVSTAFFIRSKINPMLFMQFRNTVFAAELRADRFLITVLIW